MSFIQFPALQKIDWIEHIFTTRHATATPERHVDNLVLREKLPITPYAWKSAQQIHSNRVVVVTKQSENCQPETDALCTQEKNIALAISVADCCVIYVVDPLTQSIGLAHSGRQGTEKNILQTLVEEMKITFGTAPSQLIVQLSPCIRFPNYPIDFVSQIKTQAKVLGIQQFYDCEICTASNLDHYYSYRAEQGKTGRMMAVLAKK
ncbi:MAG: polyphenol oxidase family protein [Verrucomicrobiae bacterium]|nr:polyphenol oxidase family protein [Verrucomicrobiae bacterium]